MAELFSANENGGCTLAMDCDESGRKEAANERATTEGRKLGGCAAIDSAYRME